MLKLIFSFCFALIISSCAKISPLVGGDKDTLSPVLIYSDPKNHSINFKEKVFSFELMKFKEHFIKLKGFHLKKNIALKK